MVQTSETNTRNLIKSINLNRKQESSTRKINESGKQKSHSINNGDMFKIVTNILPGLAGHKEEQEENKSASSPKEQKNEKIIDEIGKMEKQMRSTPKNSCENLSYDTAKLDEFMARVKNLLRRLDEMERLAKDGLKIRAKLMFKDIKYSWEKMDMDLNEVCMLAGVEEEKYFESYQRVAGRYFQAIEEMKSDNQSLRQENTIIMTPLKLEPLKIPTFNGTYEDWPTFSSLFKTLIIENDTLCDIQKMQYLKSVVTDDAERAISNLYITKDNFKKAWEILCERFDNKQFLIDSHMNSILEMEQIDENSAQQLKFFYDKSKLYCNMLKDVSGEQWIVYVLKNKLDEHTRTIYEELIENNKIKENMETFFTFLRKRCRVLESIYDTEIENNDDSMSCFSANVEAGEYVHD